MLHVHCNAGVAVVTLIGTLPGYGDVWYHPGGIANVLSLAKVSRKYKVTYDSENGHGFVVHSPNKPTFKETEGGLHAFDMSRMDQHTHMLADSMGDDESGDGNDTIDDSIEDNNNDEGNNNDEDNKNDEYNNNDDVICLKTTGLTPR